MSATRGTHRRGRAARPEARKGPRDEAYGNDGYDGGSAGSDDEYGEDEYSDDEYADEPEDRDDDFDNDADEDDDEDEDDFDDDENDENGENGEGGDGDDEGDGGDRDTGGHGSVLSATDAAEAGVRHVVALTGRQSAGVTALERTAEGWAVEVEVVEDRRVPSSSDILGLYRAEIDADGSVTGYRRTRRYQRGRGDDRGER